MKRFESLVRRTAVRKRAVSGPEGLGADAARYQQRAEDELPALLAEVGLRVWHPGDPIRHVGRRVLLGIAAWSRQDLRLLDELAEAMVAGRTGDDTIDVFQFWRGCKTQDQLDWYVPGMDISSIFHSPVVGVWHNGVLRESASGAEGRALLARIYGLPAKLAEGERGPANG